MVYLRRHKGFGPAAHSVVFLFFAFALFLPFNAHADFNACAIDWNLFQSPGFISNYTYKGQIIRDHESSGSGDPSRGPANVPPAETDLASGVAGGTNPGPYATPAFGYYNGGTRYDPNDPQTMEDDYIFFRIRIVGDPWQNGNNFKSYHWNVLLDIDADGYKEYWLDLEGNYSSNNYDRLNVLYDNSNRQDITNPDAPGVRVEYFRARYNPEPGVCTYGYSHTRVRPTNDGTGNYWIEVQVPMTAFNDSNGNQLLWPTSPVAFVFSTGASNQNPLQKDWMMDLKYLSMADPIEFGDIVIPNGKPIVEFTNSSMTPVSFYTIGNNIYIYVKDPLANTNNSVINTITVTVTDASTGDDEALTLVETGPSTGIFTNTSGGTQLTTSTSDGIFNNSDGNQDLEVLSGHTIYVSYTNPDSLTVTDSAGIVAPCEAFIEFTRANGLPTTNFIITNDRSTSDKLYVTVTYREGNTNPSVAETITVYLTGNDAYTMTLTETGVNTGVFRNTTTGLETEIEILPVDLTDSLWEDMDGGSVTATYSYNCGGNPYVRSTTASLFTTVGGGRVYFTNGAGTQDVELYGPVEPVFIKVVDSSYTCAGPLQVTVTSTTGDSETITLTQTFAGSGVYINRKNDLATTSGSAVVNSASSTFITDGLVAGGVFTVANGPDAGLYTIASVNSQTQLTLNRALSSTRTGVGFNAKPLMTSTYSGSYTPNNNVLTASDEDTLTVSYYDCDDGDTNPLNNYKTDTAAYNSPAILINEVLFYPNPLTCQTEFVRLYNSSTYTVNVTGYRITDGDAFSYTIPQFAGSDLILGPGEKIYISLYNFVPANYFDSGVYYLFAPASSYPSDVFGDPASPDPADQVSLYNSSGTIIDYVAWSSTSSPSLDFQSDDADAVRARIWTDDSFVNVSTISIGYAIKRSIDGYDSNTPSDWVYNTSADICNSIITRSLVSSFGVRQTDKGAIVEWETASENRTVGFDLFRMEGANGVYRKVNQALLPALLASPEGGKYSLADTGASSGGRLSYLLVEVDTENARTSHGPFTFEGGSAIVAEGAGAYPKTSNGGSGGKGLLYKYKEEDGTTVITDLKGGTGGRGAVIKATDGQGTLVVTDGRHPKGGEGGGGGRTDGFVMSPKGPSSETLARLAEGKREKSEAQRIKARRGGARIKIPVVEDGLYYMGADEIASLMGLSPQVMERTIRGGKLSLRNRGLDVSYLPARGGGIYFYGKKVSDSIFTDENVYWLSLDRGRQMEAERGRPPRPSDETGTFFETLHFEVDRYAGTSIFDDPMSDYWLWDFIISHYPGMNVKSFAIRADGAAGGRQNAYLTVNLKGATNTRAYPDHHVEVSLNGTPIGGGRWDGTASYTLELSFGEGLLRDGENTVTIQGVLESGVSHSIFYLDSFDLTYRRLHRAVNDSLLFGGGGNPVVSIKGFSSPDVMLFDISDPMRPKFVTGTGVDLTPEGYRLSFVPSFSEAVYFAAAPGGALRGSPGAYADVPSDLRGRANGADYLIITTDALRAAAEQMSAYRRSLGHETMVVLVEDIMDEFNYGISSPLAIRDFLDYAYTKWSRPPEYVFLAGEGSYDYKNALGYGDSLIPPLMVFTPNGLFPSDNALADFDGDHVPEIAVGRLPAITGGELRAYVEKVMAYEAAEGGQWQGRIYMLADEGEAGAFASDSDEVAGLVPGGYETFKIYLGATTLSQARQALLSGINGGALFVNFIGHGGLDRISNRGLLTRTDAEGLSNGPRLPVLAAMTCIAGQYAIPGYDSLGETLAVKQGGGAAAVWAPSGWSINSRAKALDRGLFRAVFGGGSNTLGNAVLSSFREYPLESYEPFMIDIFNIMGDPALRVRNP